MIVTKINKVEVRFYLSEIRIS